MATSDARSRYGALVRVLSKRDKRIMSCKISRWVLTEFKVEDPRLWEAVAVAERYAEGLATEAELFSARDSADSAAMGAASSAARDTREAARAAVWAAVWAAVGDAEYAAMGAAWAAARAAAWAAREAAADSAAAAARAAAYQMFFVWALELVIGEEVSVAGSHHLKLDLEVSGSDSVRRSSHRDSSDDLQDLRNNI